MAQGYRIASGQRTGDLSATGAVVAAVAGQTLSLKSVYISCGATAQSLTIERADGTDLIGPIFLPINGNSGVLQFAPGQFLATAGAAMNAIGSGTGSMTVVVECYVL